MVNIKEIIVHKTLMNSLQMSTFPTPHLSHWQASTFAGQVMWKWALRSTAGGNAKWCHAPGWQVAGGRRQLGASGRTRRQPPAGDTVVEGHSQQEDQRQGYCESPGRHKKRGKFIFLQNIPQLPPQCPPNTYECNLEMRLTEIRAWQRAWHEVSPSSHVRAALGASYLPWAPSAALGSGGAVNRFTVVSLSQWVTWGVSMSSFLFMPMIIL